MALYLWRPRKTTTLWFVLVLTIYFKNRPCRRNQSMGGSNNSDKTLAPPIERTTDELQVHEANVSGWKAVMVLFLSQLCAWNTFKNANRCFLFFPSRLLHPCLRDKWAQYSSTFQSVWTESRFGILDSSPSPILWILLSDPLVASEYEPELCFNFTDSCLVEGFWFLSLTVETRAEGFKMSSCTELQTLVDHFWL